MNIDTGVSKREIDLTGLIGEFDVPDNDVVIKFFCTNANTRSLGSHEHEFLSELKPMRERVDSQAIGSLDSLMQRDLNDYRVAKNLIPYILGEGSQVSFFPSILAVILPDGFLSQKNPDYPVPKKGTEGLINYEGMWSYKHYTEKGNELNIGRFSFNKSRTNIIVIDGQHRANAFRYASMSNKPHTPSIYDSFYENIDKNAFKKIENADLPVTLIWFENKKKKGKIDPKLISRKLFVDVNNNAKKINKSRSILLNEKDITCLATREFYNLLAKDSFDATKLSLLHGGFDVDSDLKAKNGHSLTVFLPEVIEQCFYWVLLGSNFYNQLNLYKVTKFHKINDTSKFQNLTGFTKIETVTNDDDTEKVCIKDDKDAASFKKQIKDFTSSWHSMYSDFILFKLTYAASKEYDELNLTSHKKEIWNKAYKGGEGLYYSILSVNSKTSDESLQNYKKALKEVDDEIVDLKVDKFKSGQKSDALKLYESVTSKAFHVGFVMALEVYYGKYKNKHSFTNRKDAAKKFIDELNKYTLNQWLFLFSTFKGSMGQIKSTDPKSWPAYQKILLFMSQDKDLKFYDSDNWNVSPLGVVYAQFVEGKFEHHIEDNEVMKISDIPLKKRNQWKKEAKVLCDKCISGCNMPKIEPVDYNKEFTNVLSGLI